MDRGLIKAQLLPIYYWSGLVLVGISVDIYAMVGEVVKVGELVYIYAMVGITLRSDNGRSEKTRSENTCGAVLLFSSIISVLN